MAARRPLYYDSGNLREMSEAMITQIVNRCVYLYGGNPSVTLGVVSDNGSLAAITDTRMKSGAASTSETANPPEETTQEPQQATEVTFDKIDQTVATVSTPSDTNNKLYPAYYDGSGAIQAMTATDVFDTFITTAIGLLVDGTDRPGTFKVSSSGASATASAVSGHTKVSDTPIFHDQKADLSAFTTSGIQSSGTFQDHPTTSDFDSDGVGPGPRSGYYHLYKADQGSAPTFTQPLQINSGNDLQVYSVTNFDAMLLAEIRHHTVNTVGSRITYGINGTGEASSISASGSDKGTMVDSRLTGGAGNYQATGALTTDDYRAQEFPNGTLSSVATYTLKINRS